MVRPGSTETRYAGQAQARIQEARQITHAMAQGDSVAPEKVSQATETLLTALVESKSAMPGLTNDLLNIYYSLMNPADQAELLGKSLAIGERAYLLFESIIHSDHSMPLAEIISPDELQSLQDVLREPIDKRLHLALSILEGAHQEMQQRKPSPQPGAPLERSMDALPNTRWKEYEEKPGKSSLDNDKWTTIDLNDPNLPLEIRLEAALLQGPSAIPSLLNLLNGGQDEQELGAVGLIHLGRNDLHLAREIYYQVQSLGPKLRPVAEFISRGLTGGERSSAGGNFATPHPIKSANANIPTGWLERTLDSCDVPNILRAAVGREALAIPLILRQLGTVRATPHHGQDRP